jgi:hypothetical protein
VGTYKPFSDELLQDLYPEHGRYVSGVSEVANSLMKQGFLMKKESLASIREASESDIGDHGRSKHEERR